MVVFEGDRLLPREDHDSVTTLLLHSNYRSEGYGKHLADRTSE